MLTGVEFKKSFKKIEIQYRFDSAVERVKPSCRGIYFITDEKQESFSCVN